MLCTSWILLPVILSQGPAEVVIAPDRVERAGGKVEEGRVVFDDAERLVLRVKSVDTSIPLAEVVSVQAIRRDLPRAMEQVAALEPDDASAHYALAELLAAINLPHEARLLHWRVLARDPGQAKAHEALGHVRRNDLWHVRDGGRLVRFDKLEPLHADWSQRWRLATSHFDLESNLDLQTTVEAALLLEQVYRVFYQQWGKELELYEITERMPVSLHADDASYPEPKGKRAGYFNVEGLRVELNAAQGFAPSLLVHEISHQLLYLVGKRQEPPSWLDEGLAHYMEGICRIGPEGFTVEPRRRLGSWFSVHASSERPMDLGRVLNLGRADFISTYTPLAYGASYTLFCFCLEGRDGDLRGPFLEYFRACFRGQGSSTSFKKLVAPDERQFEQEWLEYVRSRSG